MAEYGTEIGKFSFEGNNLMPEVIIKGRIRQEKHESTERFYGIRYIGKEALEHIPELLKMENCKFDNTPFIHEFDKLKEVIKQYAN